MTDHPHEDVLQAYVDGQLDALASTRMEAYLAAHPDERSRIESYRRQKALIREALLDGEDLAVSPAQRTRTLEQRLGRSLLRQKRALPLMQIAAGLAIFSLGALSHAGLETYRAWRAPAALELATQAHQVFSADALRPVELPASRRAEMTRWFERHLGTEVEIPDLRSLSLRLVGGRLLASPAGPMAQLLYEDRQGGRLTMYLTAEENDIGSEVQVVKVASFAAGYWQDGELTYTIIADMEAEALLALAAEMSGNGDFPQL